MQNMIQCETGLIQMFIYPSCDLEQELFIQLCTGAFMYIEYFSVTCGTGLDLNIFLF